MLDKLLLNPTINRTFAMLDDSKSMASIATRDMVDSSGRTYMEYQRNPHGGRERLVEELLTWGIWGFGVKQMKDLYDRAVTGVPLLKKLNIQQPNLDISLLPGKGSAGDGQKLSNELVEKFARRFEPTGEGQYHQLLNILKSGVSGRMQNAYRYSSVVKFLLATGAPVATIAFGIPTLNQWWTRKELASEDPGKSSGKASGEMDAAKSASGQTSSGTEDRAKAEPGSPVKQEPLSESNGPGLQQQKMPGALPAARNRQRLSGLVSPWSAVRPGRMTHPQTGTAFRLQPTAFTGAFPPVGTAILPASPGNAGRPPKFGGLGELASTLLQNEQYNTLLVDGTISGGRVIKARNWHERMEILFREASVIFFLYFAQGFIQNQMIGKAFEKLFKIPTQMDFSVLKHLHDHIPPERFQAQYRQSLQDLTDGMSTHLNDGKPVTAKDAMEKLLLRRDGHRDPALVETIRNYFLEGKQGNLILDAARSGGWIPTFKDKAGRQCLDLSQKIETTPIFNLIDVLGNVAAKTRSRPSDLQPLLRKAMTGRAGAWLLANGVCAFALSYAAPKIQHYLTYLQTGKHEFPGIETTRTENQDKS